MDAKKAALVVKPIYYKDTKSFKFGNLVFVGFTIFTLAFGVFAAKLIDRGALENTFFRRKIREHVESDEFKQMRGRFCGIYPPTKQELDDHQALGKKFNPMSGM